MYGQCCLTSSLISLTVLSTIILNAVANDGKKEDVLEIAKKGETDSNIAFDLPDLAVIVETASGLVQLEAYKSVHNDQILRDALSKQVSQLFWVSVGQPILVKTPNSSNTMELFHINKQEITTYVQMLTSAHRSVLSSTAQKKYQVQIGDSQIVNLILSKFECSITMYDETGKKYIMKGTVSNFRQFPLRLIFPAPPKSKEGTLFREMIQEDSDLNFQCSMASNGRVAKTNTFTITSQQQQTLHMEEKLFGTANKSQVTNNSYVSRDQMTGLSNEVYSDLNIVEDYQMSEGQFSAAFVEGMINQIATEQFKLESIDSVLSSISKYGLDIRKDISPDTIKKYMGMILTVEEIDKKERIILNKSHLDSSEKSNSRSGGISANAFGFGVSTNWARSNSQSSTKETKSLDDQLRELNSMSKNEAEWERQGNTIIPKSLNVAKVSRSKLGKTLRFSRVRVQSFEAKFDRQFTIHTETAAASPSYLEALSSRITRAESELQNLNARFTSSIEKANHWRNHPRGIDNE